jgi:uncharacterized membrane protein YczE
MTAFKEDVKRVPKLFLGLLILGFGIYLTKLSAFGMSPWAIFHQGLTVTTGIPFGFITQIVGVIVLIVTMVVFHTKVGIGTISNVLIVGPWIALLDTIYQVIPESVIFQFLVFLAGLLLMTFGRSLYISSQLGQGPRDGLFVGLAKTSGIQVKYVKLIIEFTVFLLGTLLLLSNPDALQKAVGIGTLIVVFGSGYLVQWYFKLLGYHPNDSKNHNIMRYFHTKDPL